SLLCPISLFLPTEVCSLPPQTGPCKARMERYFYNPASSSCEVFVYGGCGGNENNFKNQEQCMKTCGIPPETGPCKAYFNRYYYDPASMCCKHFIYGGCMGNQNNFITNAQCLQACLPDEVCNQPPETGQCDGHFQKYFYNSTSMNCEDFVYGGCGKVKCQKCIIQPQIIWGLLDKGLIIIIIMCETSLLLIL
uniref:BPTI/Kunitz inhibitor domain-containing protein n=1 Tax=Sphaeramia orbicularis TaxID=375764 RepID=A0A673B910_9TELE